MKYRIERSPDGEWIAADVWKRGSAIITDSLLNKGTAFSPEERMLFELEGMIPYRVTDRDRQIGSRVGHRGGVLGRHGDAGRLRIHGAVADDELNQVLTGHVGNELG